MTGIALTTSAVFSFPFLRRYIERMDVKRPITGYVHQKAISVNAEGFGPESNRNANESKSKNHGVRDATKNTMRKITKVFVFDE
jgi:hypothetical protein